MRDYEPVYPVSPRPPYGWFPLGDGSQDYLSGFDAGVVHRESTVHIDGLEHPVVLMAAGTHCDVQLPQRTADALTGGVPASTWFRRVGLGRVRRDGATPLQPAPSRVWIHDASDDAVLVVRPDPEVDHFVFFRLGPLPLRESPVFTVVLRVRVAFWLAEDYLPYAGHQHRCSLVRQGRAFGGMVAYLA